MTENILPLAVILFAVYIYSALCLQFIAQKTGCGPIWLAWIPLANLFLLCKIAGINYLWLLIILAAAIPIVGIVCLTVFTGLIWYKIALRRNKPGWLGILSVIPAVNLVIMGYLAFSD